MPFVSKLIEKAVAIQLKTYLLNNNLNELKQSAYKCGHSVLFSRLKVMSGLSGNVLDWFKSYLGQRTQRVSVHDVLSDPICLLCGVPQGSVLGPLIFTLYTRPLGMIAQKYGVGYHFYADECLVWQVPLCGTGYRRKLEINHHLKVLNYCLKHICLRLLK